MDGYDYDYSQMAYEPEKSGMGLKIGLIIGIIALGVIIILVIYIITRKSGTSTPAPTPASTTPATTTPPATPPTPSPVNPPPVNPPTFPPASGPTEPEFVSVTPGMTQDVVDRSVAMQLERDTALFNSKTGPYNQASTISYVRKYPYYISEDRNEDYVSYEPLYYMDTTKNNCLFSAADSGIPAQGSSYQQAGWFVYNNTPVTLKLEFLHLKRYCESPDVFDVLLAEIPAFTWRSWSDVQTPKNTYPLLSVGCGYRLSDTNGKIYRQGEGLFNPGNEIPGPNFLTMEVNAGDPAL